MTPERLSRIRSVLDQRQPDLTVITEEVQKGRNLSAIIRTCDAVGIPEVHSVVPREGFTSYNGTAASAHKWVDIHHYSTALEPITALTQQGYQIVAAHVDRNAKDFREIDYTKPTALLMGAEIWGVSEPAQELVTHTIHLPMVGMIESYNVSVACAGILLEAQRQRQEKGLYSAPRLNKDRYDALFFRWAHPKIAKFCHEKNIPYPPLDEEGEIINPAAWYHSVR